MSQDELAGFWADYDPVYAVEEVPGAEVAEGVSLHLSKPRNLSREHREPGAGGCGALGKTGVG